MSVTSISMHSHLLTGVGESEGLKPEIVGKADIKPVLQVLQKSVLPSGAHLTAADTDGSH